MKKFFFLLILFVPFSSELHAVCDNFPPDLTEPNYGVVEWIGGGYESNRERIAVNTCLNGEKVRETANSSAEFFVGLLTDYQEVYRELQRSSGGKIKIGWFSFGKSRSFTEKVTDKAYSQTFVLAFDIKTGNGRFAIDGNDPLNNLADRVKHDACEFKKYCGDSFVFQTEEGVKLLLGIQISFSSNQQRQEYNNGFNAGVEGALKKTFNICTACGKVSLPFNISFSGEFNTALGQITDSLRQQGRIEVFAVQQGGDVARLGQALGANGALGSCSLDNRAACLQMADNVLAYIASEAFIQGVYAAPAVLNYAKRSYNEVDPDVPTLESEITPEIENARSQLATEFDTRLADIDVLDTTLGLALSDARRQQLTQLRSTLDAEVQSLHQTGLLCFSDLANCPQKAAQVLAELQAYDRAAVQPNPVDGLVAYYPFNTNALDESGNGNDGVVNGASLTQDRNGKVNSAFLFGVSDYIKIDNTAQQQFSNITISAWVKPLDITTSKHHEIIRRDTGYGSFLFAFQEYGSLLTFGINNTPVNESDTPINPINFVDGEWHFVTGNYNGNKIVVYADGQFIDEKYFGVAMNQDSSSSPIFIGSAAGVGEYFNGAIDDIRIYNRALTPTEIQQLYQTTETQLNQAPLAMFTTSATQGAALLTVNLDASASSDADGSISHYDWQSSDGQGANGKTAALTFNAEGEYSITLTVTDDQGVTSQAMKNITVTGIIDTFCTNASITNCHAYYEFNNNQGSVCIPCVVVPSAFGTSQIFALEMLQSNPLSLAFEINPLTLKAHTFQDSCAASYSTLTGLLNLPCLSVGSIDYNVDMQQRLGGLIFDVAGVR